MHNFQEKKRLWTLFISMIKISSFTFGGGFVIVTFMRQTFVEKLKWLTEDEMMDMTAIAQSCPGAIAVNAAIQVGWKVSGFTGMLVSVFGTIIPPMIVISIISFFYKEFESNKYVILFLSGMKAGIAAIILDVVFILGNNVLKEKSWIKIALMVLSFGTVFFFKINIVLVLLATVLFGIIASFIRQTKKEIHQ